MDCVSKNVLVKHTCVLFVRQNAPAKQSYVLYVSKCVSKVSNLLSWNYLSQVTGKYAANCTLCERSLVVNSN